MKHKLHNLACFSGHYSAMVQVLLLLWYFIFVSDARIPTKYPQFSTSGNCSDSSGLCIYNKPTGCILITSVNRNMTHNIQLQNKTSLIYLKMSPVDATEVPDGKISIIFSEASQSTAVWNLPANRTIKNNSIITQSHILAIDLSLEGNWTNLIFDYEELMFETNIETSQKDSGSFGPPLLDEKFYRPNTLMIYHLEPSPTAWNESSVIVTLWSLDVDDLAGDYLLIGAGKQPFSGPPAAFVTGHRKQSQQYYVADDDAYVLFLSQVSNERMSGFRIGWERSGNRIRDEEDPEDEAISDSVLQAVTICFYNASAIQEFNQTDHEAFPAFREKFASIASTYVKEKEIQLVPEIKANSIKLFRVSFIIPPGKDFPDGVLYAMLTIIQPYDEHVAIFRWQQMEEILTRYDADDGKLLGYKTGKCPPEMDYRDWSLASILLLLACTALFFGVWFWRYNVIWKSRRFKDPGEQISFDPPSLLGTKYKASSANKNIYQNGWSGFVPKLKITNEDGYSASIHTDENEKNGGHYSTLKSPEDLDVEIHLDDWILKEKPSNAKGTPETQVMKTFPVPTKEKRVGKSVLWGRSTMCTLLETEPKDSMEHLYDSLDVEAKGGLISDDCETKL